MNEPMNTKVVSRRSLLAGASAIGLGLIAAACGDDKDDSTTATTAGGGSTATTGGTPSTSDGSSAPTTAGTTPMTESSMPENVDGMIAQLAASLEVLAVGTYKAALDAAGAGQLGDVPPAVAEFAMTVMTHHQAHLDAWNDVITGAGGTAVTEPNATLKPTVDAAFAEVTDAGGAAMLALQLEQIAAATYNSAQGVLTDKGAIKLAGSIQVIDAQHVAILLYALGQYPVPDTFARVDMAATG